MKNSLIIILFLAQVLLSGDAFSFSDKEILPMDKRYRECKVGMVIECKVDECDSICASMIAAEKEEKELQRLEETKEVIKQGTEEGIQSSKEATTPQ